MATVCMGVVQADQFHNINQIVGDRAIGLAGAYAAISDDPAGMVYNPAGIAFATSSSLSANVNTLQFNQISYADALNNEFDFQRQSYQVLPNFFGVVQPFGKWKVGFYNAIVDSVQEKQDQAFDDFGTIDRFVINLNNLATTYNVGPAAAIQLSEQLSFGMSVALHYRSTELISNQHIDFKDSATHVIEWQNIYLKTSEQGLRPKLGLSYSPMPKLSFGVSVDQTFVVKAQQTEQLAKCETNSVDVGCSDQSNPSINKYSDTPKYPLQVRIGGAWFASSAFLFSADVVYNSAVEQSTAAFIDREQTLDVAAGVEWYWSSQWALRSGLFTSMANTPHLNLTDNNQSEHIDYYGGTFSVARFNKGSSISLGLLGRYGTGESQLFGDLAGTLQQATSFDVTAFFTTSYRY